MPIVATQETTIIESLSQGTVFSLKEQLLLG